MSHGRDPGVARIVLIGFMAAGKSTVGRALADRLHWDFVDFDARIEARAGAAPGAIIRERGEPAFRSLEAELTDEVAGRSRVVLAPGGGWVTETSLADRLGSGTVRVWLRISAAEAVRRAARSGVDRPLLGEPGGQLARARRLLREREPLYARAELAVDVDGKEPDAVVEEIVRRLALNREDDE